MRTASPTTRRSALAVAASVAFAACADSHTLPLTAPSDAAPRAAVNVGYRNTTPPVTTAGITPVFQSGNLSGEGNSACALVLGPGATGVNIDGANSAQVAGYQFTVTNGGTTLSFAPAAGKTPTSVITAVVVKGGPAYFVYKYGAAGATTDGGLVSPINNGGQLPTISHYIACYGPPGTPSVRKKLIGVMTDMNSGGYTPYTGGIVYLPAYNPDPTVQEQVSTGWLLYEIDYTLPAGVTATLTDDYQAACNTLGVSKLICASLGLRTSPDVNSPWGRLTSVQVSGTGKYYIYLDVTNNNDCKPHQLTNTAVLSPSSSGSLQSSTTVTVQGTGCK